MVKIGDEEVERYLPIFDQLLQDVETELEKVRGINFTASAETVPYGQPAEVIKTGEPLQPNFHFKIPEGKTNNAYTSIKKIKDFLYEIYYNGIDYDYAKEHLLNINNVGACTSFRKGDLYGRNLDWTYDNSAEFIIRTPHYSNRFSTIGVAGGISELTNDFVQSKAYSEAYKLLPFYMLDGINEKGVFCNTNVVPVLDEPMTHTTPTEELKEELPILILPRYILDNFDSADNAIDFITKHIKLYANQHLQEMGYEVHFMIGDSSKTYILEIINNQIQTKRINYMTNFHLTNAILNEDGKVYSPADVPNGHLPTRDNNIYKFGSGLERFNLVVDSYEGIGTRQDARVLLNNLLYTKSYLSCEHGVSDPFWFTEYVGNIQGTEHTVDSVPADFVDATEYVDTLYRNRSRNDEVKTWQTVHSSLYDMKHNKLYIVVQEDGEELEYPFDFFSISNNYEELINLPFINDIKLLGHKSLDDLGIQPEGDYVEDEYYTHTDNNFTTDDKNKLDGIDSLSNDEIERIIPD